MDNSEVTQNSELLKNEGINAQMKAIAIEKFNSLIDSADNNKMKDFHLRLLKYYKNNDPHYLENVQDNLIISKEIRNKIKSLIKSFETENIELLAALLASNVSPLSFLEEKKEVTPNKCEISQYYKRDKIVPTNENTISSISTANNINEAKRHLAVFYENKQNASICA